MPAHNQAATNGRRGVLGSKDGGGGSFGTHTETEKESADEELVPVLREGRSNHGERAKDTAKEQDTATTPQVVEWVSQPASYEP